MLYQLSIRNVAIIEHAEITFEPGLNILTGETGAGKSMVIDSVNLALGERADKDKIRSGQHSAVVEALFTVDKLETEAMLQQMELWDEEGQLLIRRELFDNGRHTVRINGHMATLAQLRALTETLVDMHGQHEHQSLLNASKHVHLLDAYGGKTVREAREKVAEAYEQYALVRRSLDDLTRDEHERLRRLDLLAFQINEIEEAGIRPGEAAELQAQRDKLRHAGKIHQAVIQAYQAVYGGEEGQRGATELVSEAVDAVRHVMGYDEALAPVANALQEALYQLEDASDQLSEHLDMEDGGDAALDAVEDRLQLLARMQRKYGQDEAAILKFLEASREEYDRLSNSEQLANDLQQQLEMALRQWQKAAKVLSDLRRKAAQALEKAVVDQLKDLGMQHARFETAFAPKDPAQPDRQGGEEIQFMLSANPGESLRPLSKIASGGEMSRILLAMKTVTASVDGVPTLIFDEIDTGISGEISARVGRKLAIVGAARQVICVTHSAQIAAMADHHCRIEKQISDERTRTVVTPLDPEARVDEINRLLGGVADDAVARTHAEQLLLRAAQFKNASMQDLP